MFVWEARHVLLEDAIPWLTPDLCNVLIRVSRVHVLTSWARLPSLLPHVFYKLKIHPSLTHRTPSIGQMMDIRHKLSWSDLLPGEVSREHSWQTAWALFMCRVHTMAVRSLQSSSLYLDHRWGRPVMENEANAQKAETREERRKAQGLSRSSRMFPSPEWIYAPEFCHLSPYYF